MYKQSIGLKLVVTSICALLLTACSMQKPHQQAAKTKADTMGLSAIERPIFDGTFVAQDANFAQYKKIQLAALDFSQVKIRKPSSNSVMQQRPWELNAADKTYYQEKYTSAAIQYLISSGDYVTSSEVGSDVMRLEAKLLEIAPLADKDDLKGRPGITKVYSEGFGTMTLEFTLYDVSTGKVLAVITDQRELGSRWEENNRATNYQQIRLGFLAWMRNLKQELQRLSAR
jgi:hypothetical protein